MTQFHAYLIGHDMPMYTDHLAVQSVLETLTNILDGGVGFSAVASCTTQGKDYGSTKWFILTCSSTV